MILIIFAVRDVATASYDKPMFMVSEGQMIRAFSDEVNRADKDNVLYRHPNDYEVFRVGLYDTDTGIIEPVAVPVAVVSGKSVAIRE